MKIKPALEEWDWQIVPREAWTIQQDAEHFLGELDCCWVWGKKKIAFFSFLFLHRNLVAVQQDRQLDLEKQDLYSHLRHLGSFRKLTNLFLKLRNYIHLQIIPQEPLVVEQIG